MPPDFRSGKLRTLSLARNELQLWERGAWSPEVCRPPLTPRRASRPPHRHRRPAHPARPTSAADATADATADAALTHYARAPVRHCMPSAAPTAARSDGGYTEQQPEPEPDP